MKSRTLILVRHAHRDTDLGRERDNGLSEKGKEQAKAVSVYFRKRFPKVRPLLLSSPKIRCIETLLPISDKLNASVETLDLLTEQHETDVAFKKRLEKFFRWWKQRGPEVVVLCSHGDWIPAFCEHALGVGIQLKKGGWIELEGRSGAVSLVWVLQRLG